MYLKTTFSLAFVLLTCINVLSQTKSVDIDNFRFTFEYRNTPEKPVNPLFFTYSTKVIPTKTTEQRVSIDEINDNITVAGQQKVDIEEDADITIVVELGNLTIGASKVSERRVENKDRNGKVTSVSRYYSLNVIYTFNGSYKIYRKNSIMHESVVYSNGSPQTYTSPEYGSSKDASDYWRNNRDMLISEFTTTLSKQVAFHASNYASVNYGFPVIKKTDVLQITDEKKHLENETFRGMCSKLKIELESMTAENGLIKENLTDIIKYFEQIPQKYTDVKRKADIKLRYAAYYNLCKIYYYLDEPDNIAQYADLLIANDYDKKDGERLKKDAERLKAVLTRTKINTRHFDPYGEFEFE
ncbi:MAG: hypothetical protein LBK94_11985 [Prevotellaceae bacterium]|jgi:hypothetical protein|nr:hypothetical protein [Prevotellaceae bacterium]